MPTVAEYLPAVVAAASPGTRRTYGSSWRRMAAALGEWRIDAVRASDIEALMRQAAAGARPRRNSRNGRHAGEHLIAAARAFYNRAIADGYLTVVDSPAHRVRKPRRLPNTRRALTPTNWPTSTPPPAAAVTTSCSTPYCCACTPKLPAGAAAPWRCA
ncbi:hypothetical protein ABZ388_15560 [Micromonospora parva]